MKKKILPPLLPGFELATFRSRVRRSDQQAIPAPLCNSSTFFICFLATNLSSGLRVSPCWFALYSMKSRKRLAHDVGAEQHHRSALQTSSRSTSLLSPQSSHMAVKHGPCLLKCWMDVISALARTAHRGLRLRKDWKRICAESSVMSPGRPTRSVE